jgi:CO/xanthine dehydrogenase Mo-binding subunit
MAGYKLLGHNYTTPDLVAKVTGRAKFAEDYRADGMLFCKLLLSPMPHCRVRRIDTREALAMPGVKAILTADDLPAPKAAGSDAPSLRPEAALTNEPVYRGEPILAIAAVDEATAAAAIESIVLDLQPLPFVVDPLASLRPGSPNARREGNAFVGGKLKTHKWTAADFAAAADGVLPTGEPGVEWPTAISMPVSNRPISSTRRSTRSRRAISRSKRAARWPTGRTASSSCTAPRRA